jgi:hypothetical protein
MDNPSSGSGGPPPDEKNARSQFPQGPSAGSATPGGLTPPADRVAPYAGGGIWRPPVPEQYVPQPFPQPRPEQPGPAVPGLTFGLTSPAGFGDAPRTGGMLAASIILAISGCLSSLIFFAILAFGTLSPVIDILGATGIADMVIAVGLFRGSRTFRIWALLRAMGCVVIFALVIPYTDQVEASWTTSILQVGFAIGLMILLLGERTAGWRVAIGIAVVMLSFIGVVGVVVVRTLKTASASFGKEFQGYMSSDRAFVDDKEGVRLDLPVGWVLLGRSNPLVSAMHAKAVAYHPQSGSYAAVFIEPTTAHSYDLDSYLPQVLKERQEDAPGTVETSREPIYFAGMEGVRLHTRWSAGIASITGYSNVCGDIFNHYVLYGWCSELLYTKAYLAFQDLEGGFRLTKSLEDRLDERAIYLSKPMPYLSQSASRQLAEYLVKSHFSGADEEALGVQSMDSFVKLLPPSGQSRFNAIFQQALSSLSRDEAKAARADRNDMDLGVQLSDEDTEEFNDMMAHAFSSLPVDKMAQISQLSDSAIELGVNQRTPIMAPKEVR